MRYVKAVAGVLGVWASGEGRETRRLARGEPDGRAGSLAAETWVGVPLELAVAASGGTTEGSTGMRRRLRCCLKEPPRYQNQNDQSRSDNHGCRSRDGEVDEDLWCGSRRGCWLTWGKE